MNATGRTTRLEGASIERLAEWQARAFPTMAPRPTPFLDADIPVDLFADRAATWAAIGRAQRAGGMSARF